MAKCMYDSGRCETRSGNGNQSAIGVNTSVDGLPFHSLETAAYLVVAFISTTMDRPGVGPDLCKNCPRQKPFLER
jgi:hypothetical protein